MSNLKSEKPRMPYINHRSQIERAIVCKAVALHSPRRYGSGAELTEMRIGHSSLLQCTCLALLTLLSVCSALDQPAGTEALGTSPWEAEAPAVESDQQYSAADADADQQPAICVVARTYWAHGGSNVEQLQQGIRSLIASLQKQSNPRFL